jgi:UDP-3-O-[3-hydroxymyristoyl] glucosamine N-acyltransferase
MSGITLEEIQKLVGGDLIGDRSKSLTGAAGIDSAREDQITFLANTRYRSHLLQSKAGAIILSKDEVPESGKNYLIVSNPTAAFQIVIEAFYKQKKRVKPSGIHPTASIDPTVSLGKEVVIGPNVVIESGSQIGDRTCLDGNVFIGRDVKIGIDCHIYPNAVVREECILGNRVILQPGVVIGSCGYGYYTDNSGKHIKLNQIGIVEILDDVEIGANSTIDRARFDKTIIGEGTKVDNLVQIGHNVEIGKHCLIVAQVGIAGSAKLGNHVILGGKVGVTGHIELKDNVMVGAYSAVSKSLEAGQYIGIPAEPATTYLRTMAVLRQLSKAHKQLRKALKMFGLED